MDAKQRAAARALVNRVYRLIGRVRIEPSNRPGRLVPQLAPGDLWRQLPALIRAANDLAATLPAGDVSEAERAICEAIGAMIDQQPAPSL